ncbi:MAG: LamG domain-containing protein [bacterium]
MKRAGIAAVAAAVIVGGLALWYGAPVEPAHTLPALPVRQADSGSPSLAGAAHQNTARAPAAPPPGRGAAGPVADQSGGAPHGAGGSAAAPPNPPSDAAARIANGAAHGPPPTAPPVPTVGPPQAPATAAAPSDDGDGSAPPTEPLYELVFDGGADRVFPTDSQEQINARRMPGGAGSIQFWLMPEWDAGNQDAATLVQLGDSGMEIVKDGDALRFRFHDTTGADNSVDAYLADWAPNQWRHVTATWLGSQLNLYVDGQLVAQNTFATAPDFGQQTNISVGSAFPGGEPAARSSIVGLHILNRDLNPHEIAEMLHGVAPPRINPAAPAP